jgi:hypothetical protein
VQSLEVVSAVAAASAIAVKLLVVAAAVAAMAGAFQLGMSAQLLAAGTIRMQRTLPPSTSPTATARAVVCVLRQSLAAPMATAAATAATATAEVTVLMYPQVGTRERETTSLAVAVAGAAMAGALFHEDTGQGVVLN